MRITSPARRRGRDVARALDVLERSLARTDATIGHLARAVDQAQAVVGHAAAQRSACVALAAAMWSGTTPAVDETAVSCGPASPLARDRRPARISARARHSVTPIRRHLKDVRDVLADINAGGDARERAELGRRVTLTSSQLQASALATVELLTHDLAVALDPDTPRPIPVAHYQRVGDLAADDLDLDNHGRLDYVITPWLALDGNGRRMISVDEDRLGFFDAPPVPRPVVTGSTPDEIARSTVAALARLGLIDDRKS